MKTNNKDIDNIIKSINSKKIIEFRNKWLQLEKEEIKLLVAIEVLANYNLAYRGKIKSLANWLGLKTTNTIKKTIEELKEKGMLNYIVDGRIYTITITEKARKDKQYTKLAKEWIEALKQFNKDTNNKVINKNLSVDWITSLKLFIYILNGELEKQQWQISQTIGKEAITTKQIANYLNVSETQIRNSFKAIDTLDLGILEFEEKRIIESNGDFITCLGKKYTSKLNFESNKKN